MWGRASYADGDLSFSHILGCSAFQDAENSKIAQLHRDFSPSAANRMIFSLKYLESAWNEAVCTYRVCLPTLSSHGARSIRRKLFFMKNQWKSMNSVRNFNGFAWFLCQNLKQLLKSCVFFSQRCMDIFSYGFLRNHSLLVVYCET